MERVSTVHDLVVYVKKSSNHLVWQGSHQNVEGATAHAVTLLEKPETTAVTIKKAVDER